VMLDLGKAIGRQHAHDVVYDAAQAAFVENKSFSDLLMADRRVAEHVDQATMRNLLDPTLYTGLCADMAREQAALARAKAKELSAGELSAGELSS
jgi:3-carboxy-cis,cis-muconate cycloisomerase